MYCNPDMSLEDVDVSAGVLGDLCSPHFDIVSRAACPNLVIDKLWIYIEEYKYEIGAVLLLTGLCLNCAGRSLIRPAACFVGFLTMIVLSCFLFYTIVLEEDSDLTTFWYYLGFGALAGLIFGLFMFFCVRFGAAVLAGYGGASIALILYSTTIYKAELDWLLWVTIVVMSLAFAVTVFFFFDETIIAATAMFGAYELVRGISCYAGHFVNEATMAKMAKAGMLSEVDPWYWVYLSGFIMATALGILVQCNTLRKRKQKESEKKKKK